MDDRALKERTLQFGLAIFRMASSLPKTRETDAVVRQVIRSATAVGANYRSACRARSKPDFILQVGIVEQETDETLYWLEVLVGSGQVNQANVKGLMQEAREPSQFSPQREEPPSSQSAIRNPQFEIVPSPELSSSVRNPQFFVDQVIRQSTIIRKAYGVGDVAQLGERRTRTAEVVGSNPIVSTKDIGRAPGWEP